MLRDLPEGTMVDGRYRVIGRVGSGGMADVLLAEDQQLGRRVALKLLHRRFAEDREFVERFRREASSAAGLQHPNVVGVFDRGEWDGTSYIAMEYLDGRTLKDVINQEAPLDAIRAIDLVVQVLRAARFAHKRGIIHRDLKPHNVMVDAEARAKVTDFGIARAGASDMTQTGSIMGTAQYLSPEQAQGLPVTPQSDLYSIGIMLYELVTGRLPFDGESAVTVALKQVNEAPVAPSALNPAVIPELDDVVLRALAKEPAERFADADAFIGALDRVRGHLAAGTVRPEDGTTVFPATAPTALAPADVVAPLPVATDVPVDPVAYLEEEDRRSRWLWLSLLAVLAIVALVFGVRSLTMTEQRTVPDVTGKPAAVALAILRNAGFETRQERVQTAGVPRERVIRQDPQPRERVDKGSTVTLTVSDGPGQRAVPDVLGTGRRAARRALTAAGFRVREQREASDTVAKDRVISASPDPGSVIEVGSTVTLTVSSGRARVAVPGVVGRSREDARAALERAGLDVSVTEREDDSAGAGTVVDQDPPAGTAVADGSTVTITVAKAPEEVSVPDVTGSEEAAAVNALSDAGLSPRTRTAAVDTPDEDGQVQRQNPSAGRKVRKGSRATITVGRFDPALNPEPDPAPGTDDGASTTTTPPP